MNKTACVCRDWRLSVWAKCPDLGALPGARHQHMVLPFPLLPSPSFCAQKDRESNKGKCNQACKTNLFSLLLITCGKDKVKWYARKKETALKDPLRDKEMCPCFGRRTVGWPQAQDLRNGGGQLMDEPCVQRKPTWSVSVIGEMDVLWKHECTSVYSLVDTQASRPSQKILTLFLLFFKRQWYINKHTLTPVPSDTLHCNTLMYFKLVFISCVQRSFFIITYVKIKATMFLPCVFADELVCVLLHHWTHFIYLLLFRW